MLSRPSDLSTDDLRNALAEGWGIAADAIEYRPVGFGSHHWTAGEWFVTADRNTERLEPALRAAVDLRAAGLEFVVAPRPTRGGRATQPAGQGYLLSVYPHIDGVAGEFGPHAPGDKSGMYAMLRRLHAATPPPTLERLVLDLPLGAELQRARRTTGPGPYGQRAYELLSAAGDTIDGLLAEYARLRATLPGPSAWVVTHGEPHPGNVMRTADGLRLVDWETVRLAPAGRDLWLVDDQPEYGFFRLRWRLADIASFAWELSLPHADTEDTSAIFGLLRDCLAQVDT